MKNYRIKVGDREFVVKAQDKVDAVKKLKDSQKFDKWSNQVKDYDPVAVNAVKEKIKELEAKIKRIEVGGVETAESRALKKKLKEYYENLEIAMKQEPIKYDSAIKDSNINTITFNEYRDIKRSIPTFGDARVNFDDYNGNIEITVNWASLGGKSSSEARKFVNELLNAIKYAEKLESKYSGFKVENK